MLLKSDELHQASDSVTSVFLGGSTEQIFIENSLKEFISELKPETSQHYVNNKRWSTHDLLRFLLKKTGPADVWFTTWSITTAPASILIELKRSGYIKQLTAIVSNRIKVNCPEALQLLTLNSTRLALAEIHAKVMIIKNESWSITVVGSQNWSKIKRIEAGVIDTSSSAANSHISWIENELAKYVDI